MAATKCDVLTRKVQEKEGRDWAAAHGFQLFEVRRMLQDMAHGSCCFESNMLPCRASANSSRNLSLPLTLQMCSCRPCKGAPACPFPHC